MRTRKELSKDLDNTKQKYLKLLNILKPCADCRWYIAGIGNDSPCLNCRQDYWKKMEKQKNEN